MFQATVRQWADAGAVIEPDGEREMGFCPWHGRRCECSADGWIDPHRGILANWMTRDGKTIPPHCAEQMNTDADDGIVYSITDQGIAVLQAQQSDDRSNV